MSLSTILHSVYNRPAIRPVSAVRCDRDDQTTSGVFSGRFWILAFLTLAMAAVGCDSGGANPGPGEEARPPDIQPARIDQVADYRSWGWETVVLENGFVRIGAVPAIGGRIMEYSIDGEESIWVNEQQFGQTPAPSAGQWPNHGGFKNWPAPQARWNWPPPPTLDYGPYEAEIISNSADSVAVLLRGQRETIRTPGLRFERSITVFRGTSRVRVEQVLINESEQPQSWSIWDITQNIVQHAPARDFDNFRVYFPINPESRYGPTGVRFDRASEAWNGEVADGIYEVRFRPDNAKLFADSRGGWVCYTDLRDGYAYVKTFPVYAGANYPDNGADVEVYVSNQNYVEVEVLGPIESIDPGGGSISFTENWYAARTDGPVLDVNHVGLVAESLRVDEGGGNADGARIRGRFGVFHAGLAVVVALNDDGEEVARSRAITADPTELLIVDATLDIAGADRLEVRVLSPDGVTIGTLAAASL